MIRLTLNVLAVLALLSANAMASPAGAYVDPYDIRYVRIKSPGDSKYLYDDGSGWKVMYASGIRPHQLESHWYLDPAEENGQYRIRNRITARLLQASGETGLVLAGSPRADGTDRWIFEAGDTFFRVRNVAFGSSYLSTGSPPGSPGILSTDGSGSDHTKIILEGLPQGAALPWTSYDEDNFDSLVDPAHIVRTNYDSTFDRFSPAAEAQKLACVILNGYGTSVSWTVKEAANALTLRYSVVDGAEGTVTLTLNRSGGGMEVRKIPVSSRQAWVYFDGGEEFNDNAAGRLPAKRYAEARILLDTPLQPGDQFSFSRESGDAMTWIDVVELETASPYIPADLSDFYVVTDAPWDAKGDGTASDYFAILQCINDAAAAGKKVYFPEGTYNIAFELVLPPGSVIQGAGMWYTELYFSSTGTQTSGGVRADGDNMVLRDLYIKGSQRTRSGGYKGIKGNWGIGSFIENVWVENTETGMWIADYYGSLGITDGLLVRNCRFRNTFADGINMAEGTRNTIVENCHFRSTGDDALASWASGRKQNLGPTFNQKFRYNTIECGYRAGGIGIFGGGAHEIHHNVVRDQYVGAGIRLNTIFIWLDFNGPQGYPLNSSGDPIRIYENTLIRTGARGLYGDEPGAIDLVTRDTDVENLVFENLFIEESQYSGVRFQGNDTLANPLPVFRNIILNNISIRKVPVGTESTGLARGLVYYEDIQLEEASIESQHTALFTVNEKSTIAAWQHSNFGTTTGQGSLFSDPNLNGLPNILEFAFGLDPKSTSRIPEETLPRVSAREVDGQVVMEINYRVRQGSISSQTGFHHWIDGIRYTVESTDQASISSWGTGTEVEQVGSRIRNDDGTESVTLRIGTALGSGRFGRILVTRN